MNKEKKSILIESWTRKFFEKMRQNSSKYPPEIIKRELINIEILNFYLSVFSIANCKGPLAQSEKNR